MATQIVFIGAKHGLTVEEEPADVAAALEDAGSGAAKLTAAQASGGSTVYVNRGAIAYWETAREGAATMAPIQLWT